MRGVEEYLTTISNAFPSASPEEFVLKQGKPYPLMLSFVRTVNEWGGGEPKNCYGDAYRLAMDNDDLTYVEGYATSGLIVAPHAWVVDERDIVIDITWASNWDNHGRQDKEEHRDYFGFTVDQNVLDHWVMLTNHYGVLGNHYALSGFVAKHGLDVVKNPRAYPDFMGVASRVVRTA